MRLFNSLLLALLYGHSAAAAFDEVVIDAGFLIEHPPLSVSHDLPGGNYIVLAGRNSDYEQQLAVYRLDVNGATGSTRMILVKPDPQLVAYDVGRLASGPALLFIAPGRILRLDVASGALVEVVKMDSVYGQNRGGEIIPLDFFYDIDEDGLDDLLVPDPAGHRVRLQLDNGAFGDESLLLASVAMSPSEDGVYFEPRPLLASDLNFDGLVDLVTWRGDALHVYRQQGDRRFTSEARTLPLPMGLPSEAQMRALERGRGAVDQSQLTEKRIYSVTDFNGDGLPDIMTEDTLSEGVFDKRNQLRLHLGRRSGDSVAYSETENALLDSKGLQFGLRETDLDNDGRMDLILRRVNLNLGRVIAALLSGSVPLQIQFYRMTDSDNYLERANHVTKTKVKFSMKSGQVDIPAIAVADFNGDELQDLAIETRSGTLALYPGEATERLFAGKPIEIRIPLPRNGALVEAEDVNGDGKSDLVIRYTVADGEAAAQSVRLLLSRD